MKYKQLVLVMAAALLPAFTGCDNPGGDSTPPDGEYGIAFVPEKFDKAVSVGYPSATERVKITNTGKKPTGPLTVSYRGGGGEYEPFTVEGGTIDSIDVGGSKENAFSITTQTGLPAGIYEANVTVTGNGINAVFNVKFLVRVKDAITPVTRVDGTGSLCFATIQDGEDILGGGTPPVLTCFIENEEDIRAQHDATTDGDGENTLTYQWYQSLMWNGGAFPHGGFLDGILPIAGATSAEYIPLSPPYHEEGTFYYYCEVTNKIKDNGDGGSKEAKSTYQNHRQYQPMVKVKVIQPAAMPVLELFTQAVGKVTGNTTGSGTVKDPVEAPTYIYDPWLITAPAMDWDVLKPALQEGLRRGKGLDADHEYYFLDLRAVTGITEWYLDILDEKYVGMGMEKVAGIYLPDSVTSMGGSALAGYRCLSEIHGANVETLQNNALNDKHYLEEAEQIDFPNLKTMGFSFMNCVNLRSVYFPEAEVISTLNQGSAFEGCTSLVTVNLPKAKTIGLFAFGRCGNLQTVCIPLAEQIGGKAFGQCPALSDIYMGDVPTLAGDWINPPGRLFALKNNAPGTITIHVPAGKVGDYTSVWEVDASTPQNGNRAVYADASFNLPYHKAVNIVGDQ